MQSDTQAISGDSGKGKGLLELALESGHLNILPLLVSMGPEHGARMGPWWSSR
jgi:hypothetical protein